MGRTISTIKCEVKVTTAVASHAITVNKGLDDFNSDTPHYHNLLGNQIHNSNIANKELTKSW